MGYNPVAPGRGGGLATPSGCPQTSGPRGGQEHSGGNAGGPRPALVGTDPPSRETNKQHGCARVMRAFAGVGVPACLRARMPACLRACLPACVRARVRVACLRLGLCVWVCVCVCVCVCVFLCARHACVLAFMCVSISVSIGVAHDQGGHVLTAPIKQRGSHAVGSTKYQSIRVH